MTKRRGKAKRKFSDQACPDVGPEQGGSPAQVSPPAVMGDQYLILILDYCKFVINDAHIFNNQGGQKVGLALFQGGTGHALVTSQVTDVCLCVSESTKCTGLQYVECRCMTV